MKHPLWLWIYFKTQSFFVKPFTVYCILSYLRSKNVYNITQESLGPVSSTYGPTLGRRLYSNFVDGICLLEDIIKTAKDLLHHVESATQGTTLLLNKSRT